MTYASPQTTPIPPPTHHLPPTTPQPRHAHMIAPKEGSAHIASQFIWCPAACPTVNRGACGAFVTTTEEHLCAFTYPWNVSCAYLHFHVSLECLVRVLTCAKSLKVSQLGVMTRGSIPLARVGVVRAIHRPQCTAHRPQLHASITHRPRRPYCERINLTVQHIDLTVLHIDLTVIHINVTR